MSAKKKKHAKKAPAKPASVAGDLRSSSQMSSSQMSQIVARMQAAASRPTGSHGDPSKKHCPPDRAEAAAEVLAAVFLHERHFDLEHQVADPPVAELDAEGHVWVTVKLHVPALDIDTWIDGTHLDHPDNQPEDE